VQSLIVWVPGRTTDYNDEEAPPVPEEHRKVKWLVDAAEHGSLDPSIAAAIKAVLSDWGFIMNLSSYELWEPLQKGVREVLKRIGTTRLAPLFIDHALADKTGAAQLGQFCRMHMHAAAAPTGVKPSQRLVMPELFALLEAKLDFEDLREMAEWDSLHVLPLLVHLLNARFQAAMEMVAAQSGCSLSQAPAKGYARTRVKLDADHRTLQSSRAAWIMDPPPRGLRTGPGVLSVHSAVAETNAAFEGTLQVKNPFAMDETARSHRDHPPPLNMSVVVAPKLTFGELVAEPTTAPIIAGLRAVQDNEFTERWHRPWMRLLHCWLMFCLRMCRFKLQPRFKLRSMRSEKPENRCTARMCPSFVADQIFVSCF
jgi:hypothetical protein